MKTLFIEIKDVTMRLALPDEAIVKIERSVTELVEDMRVATEQERLSTPVVSDDFRVKETTAMDALSAMKPVQICPHCNKAFKRLKKHLHACPERTVEPSTVAAIKQEGDGTDEDSEREEESAVPDAEEVPGNDDRPAPVQEERRVNDNESSHARSVAKEFCDYTCPYCGYTAISQGIYEVHYRICSQNHK